MQITIVTPTLNQGKFIEETIKSVINQKGDFELEYIIMDAVSADDTLKIIKKYDEFISSKKFKPKCKKLIFKWLSEKDSGQSEAINKGFKMAGGEIINWLCSDDLLSENSLQMVADFFKKNKEARVIFGNSSVINEAGKIINHQNGREFTYDELIRLDIAYNKFFVPQPSTFLKKEVFETIGPLNESSQFCMDYEWYLKINMIYKFYFLDKTLSFTRVHNNSKTVKFEQDHYDISFNLSKKYVNRLSFKKRTAYFLNYGFIRIKRKLIKLITKKISISSFLKLTQKPATIKNPEKKAKFLIAFIFLSLAFVFLLLWNFFKINFWFCAVSLLSGGFLLALLEIYLRIQHNIDIKAESVKNEINALKNELKKIKKNG